MVFQVPKGVRSFSSFFLRPWDETSWRSCAFLVVKALYTGEQPAQRGYAQVTFHGRVPMRAFAGSLLSRTLLFATVLGRELPHLHGHIFPSLAHLPLHGRIFPFMGTSSTSWAHLPFHGHVESFPNNFDRSCGAGHGLLSFPQRKPQKLIPDLHGLLTRKVYWHSRNGYACLCEPVNTTVSAFAGST